MKVLEKKMHMLIFIVWFCLFFFLGRKLPMNIYILYLHNNLKSSMFCKNDLVYMTNAQDYIMYLSCQTFFSFVTMITLKL